MCFIKRFSHSWYWQSICLLINDILESGGCSTTMQTFEFDQFPSLIIIMIIYSIIIKQSINYTIWIRRYITIRMWFRRMLEQFDSKVSGFKLRHPAQKNMFYCFFKRPFKKAHIESNFDTKGSVWIHGTSTTKTCYRKLAVEVWPLWSHRCNKSFLFIEHLHSIFALMR